MNSIFFKSKKLKMCLVTKNELYFLKNKIHSTQL